jgi:hypothetical protein
MRREDAAFPSSCGSFGASKRRFYDEEDLELSITPVRNGKGKGIHFISNDRDLSEPPTEHALFQVQKMDAIGRLSGGVAHDFNNPPIVIGATRN